MTVNEYVLQVTPVCSRGCHSPPASPDGLSGVPYDSSFITRRSTSPPPCPSRPMSSSLVSVAAATTTSDVADIYDDVSGTEPLPGQGAVRASALLPRCGGMNLMVLASTMSIGLPFKIACRTHNAVFCRLFRQSAWNSDYCRSIICSGCLPPMHCGARVKELEMC